MLNTFLVKKVLVNQNFYNQNFNDIPEGQAMKLPVITEGSSREEVEAWFAAAEKWCNECMARAKKKEAKKKRL
jgi:hypothetical protein